MRTQQPVIEFFERGELYVLSQRFLDDMVACLHGPGQLRFILQSATAIIRGVRGVRDGVKDARAGILHFCRAWCFTRPIARNSYVALRHRSAILIAVAILLDVTVQFLIFRMVHPGVALLLGPLLIALPYACSRALTNPIARWRRAGVGA